MIRIEPGDFLEERDGQIPAVVGGMKKIENNWQRLLHFQLVYRRFCVLSCMQGASQHPPPCLHVGIALIVWLVHVAGRRARCPQGARKVRSEGHTERL